MKRPLIAGALLLACLPLRVAATIDRGERRHRGPSHTYNPPFSSHFSTVVIDPGHGGFDRGGIPGQQIPEKTMALDVALRLRASLRSAGFNVILTRSDDTFIPLPGRVAIANAQANAIFVSIHFNATPRAAARGIETYYSAPSAGPLAASIQSRLAGWASTENRGIKRRGFYVLRNTRIPSVLVEPGFLTNPDEGNLILQPRYRQRIADLISQAVIGKHSGPRPNGT